MFLALALLAGLALLWSHASYVHRQPKTPAEGKSYFSVEVGQKSTRADSASEPKEKKASEEATKAAKEIDTEAGSESSQPSVRKAPIESLPAPFVLRVEALEKTWLHIIIDGSREGEYLLQPGEQLTWMARSHLELLVGNAGGIRLFLNDNPLKTLGESGRVVRLELPDPSLVFEANSEGADSGNRQ